MTRHLKRIILAFMIAFIMLFIIACEQNTISDVVPDNTAVPTIPVAQQIIPVVTDEPINNEKLAEMNSVLRRATYLEGTKVEGIDIGGKTISEAKALLEEPINQKKSSFSVILVNGEDKFLLTQDKIPLFDNLEDVLNEAFNLVREDKGYDSVMQEVREIKEKGIDFDVQLEFEPITLKLVIDEYGNAVDVKPKNASVGYDSDLNEIAFVPDESGKILDRESMLSSVKSAKKR